MKGTSDYSAMILGIVIILGLPAIGLLLMNTSDIVGDIWYYYFGVGLVFLFPILIAANLVLSKKGK